MHVVLLVVGLLFTDISLMAESTQGVITFKS